MVAELFKISSSYGEKSMSQRNYLLRIRLLDIEPEIWRRFVVPADITLDRLHDIIQIVMGWTDSHLYTFAIGKKRYTESLEENEDELASDRHRLGDLIKQKGRSFQYTYDFGDNWEHELTIEESQFSHPELQAEPLLCLDGARACPPEDVGSAPGYYEFCRAMKDRKHPRHKQLSQWYGGKYDPEYFSINAVNYMLLKYQRWSRDRSLRWESIQ
jgi:hypothetical protein